MNWSPGCKDASPLYDQAEYDVVVASRASR